MCRIFDWVFDSISVEQAPQNHFEDPNQFNQEEDEAQDTIFDFLFLIRNSVNVHPAIEPPTPTFEFIVVDDYLSSSLLSYTSLLLRPLQDYFVSFIFLNIQYKRF